MWCSLYSKSISRSCETHQDYDRLVDSDYCQNTVLLHAAGASNSATFDAFFKAVQGVFSDDKVREERTSMV